MAEFVQHVVKTDCTCGRANCENGKLNKLPAIGKEVRLSDEEYVGQAEVSTVAAEVIAADRIEITFKVTEDGIVKKKGDIVRLILKRTGYVN